MISDIIKIDQNKFKSWIIIFSTIIALYFWDFGQKYNLNIETRFLILIPLIFFLKFENFKKKGILLIIIINSYLILQYLINYFLFDEKISFQDLKYFSAFFLTTLLAFFCKDEILKNKKNIIKFLLYLSPFFILNSEISIWSDIDKSWQCAFFNTNSKLFKLFFLEPSHFGMVMIPVFLLQLFYLTEKFNLLNLILFIFISSVVILYLSTTSIVGIILSCFAILIFNFTRTKIKFFFGIFLIICIFLFIFMNIYGCSRKITDLAYHQYIYSIKMIEEDKINIETSLIEEDSSSPVLSKIKSTYYKNYNKLFKRFALNNYNEAQKILDNFKVEENKSKLDSALKKILLKVNVSSQVLKNSFEVASNTFIDRPFGVGLNNFEIAFMKNIKLQEDSYSDEVMMINRNDGGSNLNKSIAEFGIGAIIMFIYILLFILSKKISLENKLFIIPIILTQLLRGAGYFNGAFLLFFIMTILLVHENKNT